MIEELEEEDEVVEEVPEEEEGEGQCMDTNPPALSSQVAGQTNHNKD